MGLINQVGNWFANLWHRIYPMPNRKRKSGVFTAVGPGTLDIDLGFKPRMILAEFTGPDPDVGSCCKKEPDFVTTQATKLDCGWVLQLNWSVTNPRQIEWKATG